jgi:hypothetical protein
MEGNMKHDNKKDKEAQKGKPIVCRKCGKGGGTLVRVGEYEHKGRCP